MRKLFLAAVVIAAAVWGAGYYFFRIHPEASPTELLDAATGYLTSSLDYAKQVTQHVSDRVRAQNKEGLASSPKPQAVSPATPPARPVKPTAPSVPAYQPKNPVTLYLTNGGMATGDLVEDTPEGVTLRWEYGDVSFTRQEIKRQVGGKPSAGAEDIALPASATEAGK